MERNGVVHQGVIVPDDATALTVPTLLITGATGFLGGAAVAQFLQSRPDLRILLLLRGDSHAHAKQRLHQSLARFADLATLEPRSEEHTSELQSRLHLVCRL